MGWGNDGSGLGNGAGYVVMMLGMLIFWGLIVAAVVWVLRQPRQEDRASGGMVPAHRTAQQVLAERFARGEIDETEFTTRLATLHGQPRL
ncbi:MAG: hypothetical protein LH468_06975 [Nocardioides sp.]|nr:hypothetical protein [Nocardioides sp.]